MENLFLVAALLLIYMIAISGHERTELALAGLGAAMSSVGVWLTLRRSPGPL